MLKFRYKSLGIVAALAAGLALSAPAAAAIPRPAPVHLQNALLTADDLPG